MKNTDDELTDAELDVIADEGERLLKRTVKRSKVLRILRVLFVLAGIVLFSCFFFWWQMDSFEVLQHAEVLWGWTSR